MEHLYVIGIDYGTDSVRALLADADAWEWVGFEDPASAAPLAYGTPALA